MNENFKLKIRLVNGIILLAFLLCCSSAYAAEDCLSCHGPEGVAVKVDPEQYERTIHGREGIACNDCHLLIPGEDHSDGKGMLPVDCSGCHVQENLHGKDSSDKVRPQCRDCHTNHSIMEKGNPQSSVHPDIFESTCKECHASVYGQKDYLLWLPSLRIATHVKQDFSREYSPDNCIGCHQGMAVHGEKESINDDGCNKCHLSETENLAGTFHATKEKWSRPGTFVSIVLNQILLWALVIGGIGFFARFLVNKRSGRREG